MPIVAHKPKAAPALVSPQDRLTARLRWVMSTEQGRAAMWWVLDDLCGLFGQTFSGEASHQTAFHAGQRQVAIELMQQLKRAAPADYVHMLRERLEIANRDEATNA